MAFLFLPYYTGPSQLQEQAFYEQFGPVWNAGYLANHAEFYAGSGHLTKSAAMQLTDWLAGPVSSALSPTKAAGAFKNPLLHHVGIVQPSEADALTLMALMGLKELSRLRAEVVGALHLHQGGRRLAISVTPSSRTAAPSSGSTRARAVCITWPCRCPVSTPWPPSSNSRT